MDSVLILSKLLSLIVGITRGVGGGGGLLNKFLNEKAVLQNPTPYPFIYYKPLSYTFFRQMVPHAHTLIKNFESPLTAEIVQSFKSK